MLVLVVVELNTSVISPMFASNFSNNFSFEVHSSCLMPRTHKNYIEITTRKHVFFSFTILRIIHNCEWFWSHKTRKIYSAFPHSIE